MYKLYSRKILLVLPGVAIKAEFITRYAVAVIPFRHLGRVTYYDYLYMKTGFCAVLINKKERKEITSSLSR